MTLQEKMQYSKINDEQYIRLFNNELVGLSDLDCHKHFLCYDNFVDIINIHIKNGQTDQLVISNVTIDFQRLSNKSETYSDRKSKHPINADELKNIKFVNCDLRYMSFVGKNFINKVYVELSPNVEKLSNIEFKNCSLYDCYFYSCELNNLKLKNTLRRNNSAFGYCTINNLSGENVLSISNGYKFCKFLNCDFSNDSSIVLDIYGGLLITNPLELANVKFNPDITDKIQNLKGGK